MALQISMASDYGQDATYWRVGIINTSHRDGTVRITMDGYIDADTRQTADPIRKIEMETIPANVSTDGEVVRPAIYTWVKTQTGWETAIDC